MGTVFDVLVVSRLSAIIDSCWFCCLTAYNGEFIVIAVQRHLAKTLLKGASLIHGLCAADFRLLPPVVAERKNSTVAREANAGYEVNQHEFCLQPVTHRHVHWLQLPRGRYHFVLCKRLYWQVGASFSLRLPYCFTSKEANWCLHILDIETTVQECLCVNSAFPPFT